MRVFLCGTVAAGLLVAVVACSHDSPTTATPTPEHYGCILLGPLVSPSSATLSVGDTLRPSVKAESCWATPNAVAWLSSDRSVAMVDSLTGLIHALAPGNVTISAFEISDPTVKGALAVIVRK